MTNIIIQRWLERTCGLVVCWKCLLSFFAPCGRGLSSIYVTYVIGLFASRSWSCNRLVIFFIVVIHKSWRGKGYTSEIFCLLFKSCYILGDFAILKTVWGRRFLCSCNWKGSNKVAVFFSSLNEIFNIWIKLFCFIVRNWCGSIWSLPVQFGLLVNNILWRKYVIEEVEILLKDSPSDLDFLI